MSELHRLVVLERMRDVLSLLTPGEMLAVALRFECEMSFSEIGDELGISKQAVALRFRTAQDRLAREIPELARRKDNGNGSHLWLEREVAFLRAVADIEARGEVPSLPAVERETGMPDYTAWRAWARVREHGWAVQGPRRRNTRPLALTDAGREVLEKS